MRTRTLIGSAVATLVLALVVAGGLRQAAPSNPAPVVQRSDGAVAVRPLPERPVVPEPAAPVLADGTVPAEPLTAPVLEPRHPPALVPVPAPPADRVTVAVVVLPASARVDEPDAPVLVDDTGLAERLVAPELSPVELRAPSQAGVSMDGGFADRVASSPCPLAASF